MALSNTFFGASRIGEMLQSRKKLWFIGIGGVHMSRMALFAKELGFSVGGSDKTPSKITELLEKEGIRVEFSHKSANVEGVDALVYTLAISQDNPEYRRACELGLPLISRADFLSYLTADYPTRIVVSGSHGKSTVTSMLGEIFRRADLAPTVFCGAPLRGEEEGTGGNIAIIEGCEYGNSYHAFSPTLALILNVQHDHVDFFPSEEALCSSFSAFARRSQRVLAFCEDENALAAASACALPPVTFGVELGEYRAKDILLVNGCPRFTALTPRRDLPVTLRVMGRHNVANAVAAIAAADLCGVPHAAITAALADFRGVARRMELRGHLCGAPVFDDYAHHPAEIAAALAAITEVGGRGRIFAVFQSHTYTRTAAFFEEICAALRPAHRVFVAPIYAARECDTLGMSAERLARGIGTHAAAPPDLPAIARAISAEIRGGDVLLVMGAGDIDRIFAEFSPKDFTLS